MSETRTWCNSLTIYLFTFHFNSYIVIVLSDFISSYFISHYHIIFHHHSRKKKSRNQKEFCLIDSGSSERFLDIKIWSVVQKVFGCHLLKMWSVIGTYLWRFSKVFGSNFSIDLVHSRLIFGSCCIIVE